MKWWLLFIFLSRRTVLLLDPKYTITCTLQTFSLAKDLKFQWKSKKCTCFFKTVPIIFIKVPFTMLFSSPNSSHNILYASDSLFLSLFKTESFFTCPSSQHYGFDFAFFLFYVFPPAFHILIKCQILNCELGIRYIM